MIERTSISSPASLHGVSVQSNWITRIKRVMIVIVFLCVVSSQSWACIPAPVPEMLSHDELIKRAETIVLAHVTSAHLTELPEPPEFFAPDPEQPYYVDIKNEYELNDYLLAVSTPVTYIFGVSEVIKGNPKETLTLMGHPLRREYQIDTFDNHKDENFWQTANGRSSHKGSCRNDPAFSIGETYLLLLGHAMHSKSYELINTTRDDKWLAYVREKVKEQQGND